MASSQQTGQSDGLAMIKQVVEYVVRSLVSAPEQVSIISEQAEDKISLLIKVKESDQGKVIGKEGQTIKAIRALVRAINPTDRLILIDMAQ